MAGLENYLYEADLSKFKIFLDWKFCKKLWFLNENKNFVSDQKLNKLLLRHYNLITVIFCYMSALEHICFLIWYFFNFLATFFKNLFAYRWSILTNQNWSQLNGCSRVILSLAFNQWYNILITEQYTEYKIIMLINFQMIKIHSLVYRKQCCHSLTQKSKN